MDQKSSDLKNDGPIDFEIGTDARKRRWGDVYVCYWRQRTDTNAPVRVSNTPTPGIGVFERYFNHMSPLPGNKVLEVGIGLGRLVPVVVAASCHVYGIDICEAMLREASTVVGNVCVELREAEAEALPYADNFFDHVVCWAVFEALYQDRALMEMARVLKHGGRLLITGKNDDYHKDDQSAYEAEIAARNNNHPNYFTDFDALSSLLNNLGVPIQASWFFERRGDFAQDRFCQRRPKQFYEYAILACKLGDRLSNFHGPISSPYSQTFGRLHKKQEEDPPPD